MIYFKTTNIDEVEGQKVEAAIRQSAVRRHAILDFQATETYIGTKELFLANESESNIKITRIRTPFEYLLPKLILRFDKAYGFNQYKIRYSILSTIIFLLLSFLLIISFISLVSNSEVESDIISVIIFFLFFYLLTLLELRLTKVKLRSAINRVE